MAEISKHRIVRWFARDVAEFEACRQSGIECSCGRDDFEDINDWHTHLVENNRGIEDA